MPPVSPTPASHPKKISLLDRIKIRSRKKPELKLKVDDGLNLEEDWTMVNKGGFGRVLWFFGIFACFRFLCVYFYATAHCGIYIFCADSVRLISIYEHFAGWILGWRLGWVGKDPGKRLHATGLL